MLRRLGIFGGTCAWLLNCPSWIASKSLEILTRDSGGEVGLIKRNRCESGTKNLQQASRESSWRWKVLREKMYTCRKILFMKRVNCPRVHKRKVEVRTRIYGKIGWLSDNMFCVLVTRIGSWKVGWEKQPWQAGTLRNMLYLLQFIESSSPRCAILHLLRHIWIWPSLL